MAEVYLCSAVGPEGFEKEVALKRIRSMLADDPSFVEMFIAEARLASKINHANVVQMFDFDKDEDTYFLAMEFIRGRSLWEVRKRARERMEPMAPLLVAQVGAEVAKGLSYAHRLTDGGKPLNIVHRDVTPHNVLISYDGAVKLTDFGIAKASNRFTAAGTLKGKFAYMSPEQARGELVDQRTDVFALGIVLWELLTGGRLFDGDSDIAVLRAVQDSTIASPNRLNPQVDSDLDAAVMKALERDPASRFQNANELERALTRYIFGHAHSADDTDVGAYVRRLFADDIERERARDAEDERNLEGAAVRNPDDDPHGRTWKHDRELQKTEEPPRTKVSRTGRKPLPAQEPEDAPPSQNGRGSERPPEDDFPATERDAVAVSSTERSRRKHPPQKLPPPRPAKSKLPIAIGAGLLVAVLAGGGVWAVMRTSGKASAEPAIASAHVPATHAAKKPKPAPPSAIPSAPPNPAPTVAQQGPSVDPSQAANGSPAPAARAESTSIEHGVTPAAAEQPAKVRPAPVARVVPKYGALVLTVEPWAYVRIDGGKRRSVEGRKRFRLSVGRHHLELSKRPTGMKSMWIHIRPGRATYVKHNPLKGAL